MWCACSRRGFNGEDHTKDIDFSAGGVHSRWEAGYSDTLRVIEKSPWEAPVDPIEGVIEHIVAHDVQ
jgi:NTE family protein